MLLFTSVLFFLSCTSAITRRIATVTVLSSTSLSLVTLSSRQNRCALNRKVESVQPNNTNANFDLFRLANYNARKTKAADRELGLKP